VVDKGVDAGDRVSLLEVWIRGKRRQGHGQ
jgi:hypothetical protein